MLGDYMTNSLVGIKFHEFRKKIMNIEGEIVVAQQECVGK
jgi:hypothetical protein